MGYRSCSYGEVMPCTFYSTNHMPFLICSKYMHLYLIKLISFVLLQMKRKHVCLLIWSLFDIIYRNLIQISLNRKREIFSNFQRWLRVRSPDIVIGDPSLSLPPFIHPSLGSNCSLHMVSSLYPVTKIVPSKLTQSICHLHSLSQREGSLS